MQETMIFFDFSAVDAAKDRADKIGVNYEEILTNVGLTPRHIAAAKGTYARSAPRNGYDETANIGCMHEQKYKDFCTAFMLNASKYLIDKPPVAISKTPAGGAAPATQGSKSPNDGRAVRADEDLMLCLESLTQAIRTNTAMITNLREQLRNDHKESMAKLPNERAARAAEDASMALKTVNRALDAIDNKLGTLVTASQRVENKIDKGNNAALDAANKLKAVVEGVSGILGKLTRICALYEKPRAR